MPLRPPRPPVPPRPALKVGSCADEHEDACLICLKRFRKPHVSLKCRHCYHARCIEAWAASSRTCPKCRRRIRRERPLWRVIRL